MLQCCFPQGTSVKLLLFLLFIWRNLEASLVSIPEMNFCMVCEERAEAS